MQSGCAPLGCGLQHADTADQVTAVLSRIPAQWLLSLVQHLSKHHNIMQLSSMGALLMDTTLLKLTKTSMRVVPQQQEGIQFEQKHL